MCDMSLPLAPMHEILQQSYQGAVGHHDDYGGASVGELATSASKGTEMDVL